MESGELAAHALIQATRRGDGSEVVVYPRLLRERFGRGSAAGRRAVRLVTRPAFTRPASRLAMAVEPVARVGLRAMIDTEDAGERSMTGLLATALLSMASWGARVPADASRP